MPLEWLVIAIGGGALVLTVITSLRSKPGSAPEGLVGHDSRSEKMSTAEWVREEFTQKLPSQAIRIR